MTQKQLINATRLNLINRIDSTAGASVRMWAGVDCAPIVWRTFAESRAELLRSK